MPDILSPLEDGREFGLVLRGWMDRRGLSSRDAAIALETSRQVIGRWLSGEIRPRHEKAIRALMAAIDEGRV